MKYYERLARETFAPIVAVFPDEATSRIYKAELEKAKFKVKLVTEIGSFLRQVPDPQYTAPRLPSYRF